MAQRQGRIKALVTKNISDILTFELKNAKVGMPCVNHVEMNRDNTLAKVYVTFLGSKNPQKNLEELERCKRFVRSSLAKKMDTYKVPEIRFIYDTTYDDQERLEAVLAKEAAEIEATKKKD